MKQEYFVVVLAHSLRGRLRRIHIPHTAVYAVLALALVGVVIIFGFLASYARLAWKAANYNTLKTEADALRTRYRNLQKVVTQTDQQLASLEVYANEVSIAYGIKQKLDGPSDIRAQGTLIPSFAESVQDYDFLRSANAMELLSSPARRFRSITSTPNLWPVDGRLIGSFGSRSDPFSGEGEFHRGVDISAVIGTPVHVTADGIVTFSGWEGGYGLVVKVEHGGIDTWYAHLSRSHVHPGQEVLRGQVIAASGATGRVTAPHLHYEVHVNGRPMNPYTYLARAGVVHPVVQSDFPF